MTEQWVIVGRFGRPHGIKGFVTVHSFTEPRENILHYENWHLLINKQWQPIEILHSQQNNKALIVQVVGYPDRESVATLTNIEIAVRRTQLEALKPGEYYWHDLIGMRVSNIQGEFFGLVTEIIPTGSNDVLVVEGEKRHLIPYIPKQFILDVDSSQQSITVDWEWSF